MIVQDEALLSTDREDLVQMSLFLEEENNEFLF